MSADQPVLFSKLKNYNDYNDLKSEQSSNESLRICSNGDERHAALDDHSDEDVTFLLNLSQRKSELRRSHSDASGTDDKPVQNEDSDKHRLSLTALRLSSPPTRTQKAIDVARHKLQEGKEFLKQKRHTVFNIGMKNEPEPERTTVAYRRKEDKTPTVSESTEQKAPNERPNKAQTPVGDVKLRSNADREKHVGDQSTTAAQEDLADKNRLAELLGICSDSVLIRNHRSICACALVAVTFFSLITNINLLPQLLLAFLWGAYLTYLAAHAVFMFCLPPDRRPTISLTSDVTNTAMDMVDEENLTAIDGVIYKGWMNRLYGHYDADSYRLSSTNTVLVRLDRNILRLSVPKQSLGRHAYCKDVSPPTSFVSQQMFDLTGAKVVLRPKNLSRRRWWSRKYPISIIFPLESNGASRQKRVHSDSNTNRRDTGFDEEQAVDKSNTPDRNDLILTSDSNEASKTKLDELAADALDTEKVKVNEPFDEFDYETDDEEGSTGIKSSTSLPELSVSTRKSGLEKEHPTTKSNRRKVIHLFGRSAREKEQWFYKLRATICQDAYNHERDRFYSSDKVTDTKYVRGGAAEAEHALASDTLLSMEDMMSMEWILYTNMQRQFERQMETAVPISKTALSVKFMDLITMAWKSDRLELDSPLTEILDVNRDMASLHPHLSTSWVNAFAARLFYDFSRNSSWMGKVKDRIQRKLSTVRLPYFIETLTLTQLDAGTIPPKIISVCDPIMNDWGLWIDGNMEYTGGIRLVMETKVNLMKLKEKAGPKNGGLFPGERHYLDEAVPESPESTDDESPAAQNHDTPSKTPQGAPPESRGKKILHMIDKIAQSKYFQDATDNKFVKKLMQNFSDTPLVLVVEVAYLNGALVINIPPPPSDRLWYGFRCQPKITLKALPSVGDRSVNLSRITDWIENKLLLLLEKNLVVPNMDDLVVPIMGTSPLLRNYNR